MEVESGGEMTVPDESASVSYMSDELGWATVEALQLLLGERSPAPSLSTAEETELTARPERGDARAKRRAVQANLPAVVAAARRHRGFGLSLLDLIQEGILGLLRAIATFDAGSGPLSAHAEHSIADALEFAIAEHARRVGIPLPVAECERRLGRAEETLTARLGRPPRVFELAEAAGVSLAGLPATRSVFGAVSPKESAAGAAQVEVELDLHAEALRRAVSALPELEQRVLGLRYGIDGSEPCPLSDASRVLGVPRGELVALEEEALERLALERELQALRRAA
jgi:RNA polymerase primary sigma factor